MKIAAILLTAALLIANVRCFLACETAPSQPQTASPCHHRRQPGPDPSPQSCAAPAAVKADLVETGVIAHTVARNVELNIPQFMQGTLCRETSPPLWLHLGLSTVLRI